MRGGNDYICRSCGSSAARAHDTCIQCCPAVCGGHSRMHVCIHVCIIDGMRHDSSHLRYGPSQPVEDPASPHAVGAEVALGGGAGPGADDADVGPLQRRLQAVADDAEGLAAADPDVQDGPGGRNGGEVAVGGLVRMMLQGLGRKSQNKCCLGDPVWGRGHTRERTAAPWRNTPWSPAPWWRGGQRGRGPPPLARASSRAGH